MNPVRHFVCAVLLGVLALPCAWAQGHSGEQRHERAGQWLTQHKDEPPAQAEKALENDSTFRKLPPERQQELLQRLRRFSNLPPEQKQAVIQRMQRFQQLAPAQQQRARDLFTRYRQLTPERKTELTSAFRALRDVPPNQLDSVLNEPNFRQHYNDNERDILRGMTELNIGPAQH